MKRAFILTVPLTDNKININYVIPVEKEFLSLDEQLTIIENYSEKYNIDINNISECIFNGVILE